MIISFDERGLALAVDTLRRGDLCAFPTETVYGLGARADQDAAVSSIYASKGRPRTNPSIVHTFDAEHAFCLAMDVAALASRLAEAFWPGPLTLVVPARPGAVSDVATAGGSTIALRVPRHPMAQALLRAVDLPIAAPSANRSEHVSPTLAEHVERSLRGQVLVLDGGSTGFGIESTIVRVHGDEMELLRRGSIAVEELETFGPLLDRAAKIEDVGAALPSPGVLRRHYAPAIPAQLSRGPFTDGRAAHLVFEGTQTPPNAPVVALGKDAATYARGLYAALYELEQAQGVTRIVIEEPPELPAWAAVRDRLLRAVED